MCHFACCCILTTWTDNETNKQKKNRKIRTLVFMACHELLFFSDRNLSIIIRVFLHYFSVSIITFDHFLLQFRSFQLCMHLFIFIRYVFSFHMFHFLICPLFVRIKLNASYFHLNSHCVRDDKIDVHSFFCSNKIDIFDVSFIIYSFVFLLIGHSSQIFVLFTLFFIFGRKLNDLTVICCVECTLWMNCFKLNFSISFVFSFNYIFILSISSMYWILVSFFFQFV